MQKATGNTAASPRLQGSTLSSSPILPHFDQQKNQIVVVLLIALMLLLFMDYQARRHYQSIAVQDKKKDVSPSGAAFEEELEEAREKWKEHLDKKKLIPAVTELESKPAQSILGTIHGLKEELKQAVKKHTADEIQKAKVNGGNVSEILTKLQEQQSQAKVPPPLDVVPFSKKQYNLYFIQFHKRKSKLVSVLRYQKGNLLRLSDVLSALQKGPHPSEKSLLNNFDYRIKVLHVSLINGVATVNVNRAIGRMGPHVIHDRLGQLALTLRQFHQIRKLKILVEGKAVTHIGNSRVNLSNALAFYDL